MNATLEQQYREFLASTYNRTWLRVDGIEVYVRKARHWVGGSVRSTFDIASITVKPAGQGTGTAFAEFVHGSNPFEATYIECIHNAPWLEKLVRLGWLPAVASPGSVYKLR